MLIELTEKIRRRLKRDRVIPHEYLNAELDNYLASQAIASALQNRKPFLASRLGWTESSCLGLALSEGGPDEAILQRIWRYSGVYPSTPEQFEEFASRYLTSMASIDLLGIMRSPYEAHLVKRYAKHPLLTELSALEPYFCATPWSRYLAGLKVLVIHPFVESIATQFRTARSRLFANPHVLPDFELLLIKAPQTIAGNLDRFTSWSEALRFLENEVATIDFDAAILGCGAYGLPMGAFIKQLGKVCIHIGGATQVLFGITGARWRDQPAFRALQTDAWKLPLECERPANWKKVEDGCYW